MPFSFPGSPTVGQQSTQNGRVYSWTGRVWRLASAGAITYATESQARDASSTTVAMNPARTLDQIYTVWSPDLRTANTAQTGQALWQTAFSGAAGVQVGSASGGGSVIGYYFGPSAWSTSLPKWTGSTGNFLGRQIDWTKRQRFRIRIVLTTGPTANATYRVTLGKTTLGTSAIGALGVRGIGFEIRGAGALWLTAHNGTTRTDTNSGQTLATAAAYEVIVDSDGVGNATLLLDGVAVATNAGAPSTAQTELNFALFAVEATTTDSSQSNVAFEENPHIFRS